MPWWRTAHRWQELRHLPVRSYHVLGVSHCPKPAVTPASRTSRVWQHIILWGAHPQAGAVTTGKLGCSLKQQSKGDLQNKQQEQAQSQVWYSQTSRTLGFPCCVAPAPKPILPPLKLETPISILKTDLRVMKFLFCSSPQWAVSIQSLVFCLLLLVSVTGQSRQVAGPSLLWVLGFCFRV